MNTIRQLFYSWENVDDTMQETSKTRNIRDRALPHFQRFRRELKNTTRNGVYMTNFEDFFED